METLIDIEKLNYLTGNELENYLKEICDYWEKRVNNYNKLLETVMVFKDKTFCASPDCKNDCGRKMTEKEKQELSETIIIEAQVSYGYFCEPKIIPIKQP